MGIFDVAALTLPAPRSHKVLVDLLRLIDCLWLPKNMEHPSSKTEAFDYQWTTGGHEGVVHQKLIDTGGFSEVHQG